MASNRLIERDCPDCGSRLHLIGTEPNGSPLFRCLDHCGVPTFDHFDRYSGEVDPPPHHFEYYSVPHSGGRNARYGHQLVPGGKMDPEQRLWILDLTCAAFLIHPEDNDYLVFQSGTDWCHTIQLLFDESLVGVEVNPRHWDTCTVCQNRPLPSTAIVTLRRLGFRGGDLGSNFTYDGLAASAPSLARFVEKLFKIAYQEPPDFAVGVRFRHADLAEKFAYDIGIDW